MKTKNDLPLLFLLLGVVGCILRFALFAAAVDSRNLLVPNHPLEWVLWGLTLLCVVLAFSNRKLTVGCPGQYGSVGAVILAAGILWQCGQVSDVRIASLIYVNFIAAGAAFAALLMLAVSYLRKKQPKFACYAILCVYYCIQMVLSYQHWSEQTQLSEYVFGLGAVVCMTLSFYCFGCNAAGMACQRKQVPLGLLAIFFCAAAVPHGEAPVRDVCAAVFLLTELSNLKPSTPKEG